MRTATVNLILRVACETYNLDEETLLGATGRQSAIVEARAVAAGLIRRHTTITVEALATLFRRDHTTILHALQALQGYLQTSPDAQALESRVAAVLARQKEAVYETVRPGHGAALSRLRRKAA